MLFKSKYISLFVLIVALCFNLTFAAKAKKPLTPEQQALKQKLRAERKQKSEAADKLIRHSTIEEIKNTVLTDTDNLWIVFYGSYKCPYTQKFNPKWLQFQQNMDSNLYNLDNVKITKIECYGDQYDFCVSQGNSYWPELMFYYKGVKKGVYDGEDEVEDIVKYIKANKSKFMKETPKSTKTVQKGKSGLPTDKPTKKPAPPKNPSKTPPPSNSKQTKNIDEQQTKQPVAKPSKNPPTYPQTTKEVPQTTKKIEEVDNSIDLDVDNGIEDIDDNIGYNNNNNSNDKATQNKTTEPVEESEQGESHTVAYSIGAVAAFGACFLFVRKRFRGYTYARVGGSDRNPQMKYKYDKHIV